MTTWYSTDGDEQQARLVAAWVDAPLVNLEVCSMLLEIAQEQVIAFAPHREESEPIPTRYVYAQLQQAINLWNAGRVDSAGDVGMEGYSFTPRPLDKTIRGIIRPIDWKPDVY